MYWILLLVHFSAYSGRIDHQKTLGVFADQAMCNAQAEKTVTFNGHQVVCIASDNPVLPERGE